MIRVGTQIYPNTAKAEAETKLGKKTTKPKPKKAKE